MEPFTIDVTKRYAYVVIMFGVDVYVPGAITIASVFRRTCDHNSSDLLCMKKDSSNIY